MVIVKAWLLMVVNPGADHRRRREVRDARQNQAIVGAQRALYQRAAASGRRVYGRRG